MSQSLQLITLLVSDYDEAISFYTGKLGFELIADNPLEAGKRWVVVCPAGSTGCGLLLAKAATAAQQVQVGHQTGGRVFLFLHTTQFDADYERLVQQHITIVRPPRTESYGRVLVFADLYGNLWDLIEPALSIS